MLISICAFTKKGEALAREIFDNWEEMIPVYRQKADTLTWVGEQFEKRLPILFVGACGIAVRKIAPFVRDKTTDSPVLVMDENGEYIIPILSGHIGGANEIATKIATRTGAKSVITTATDVRGVFSIDVFAKNNGLKILDKKGILEISKKILEGDKVNVFIEKTIEVVASRIPDYVVMTDEEHMSKADVLIVCEDGLAKYNEISPSLVLVYKPYILGVGCRKGKTFEEISELVSNMDLPMDMVRGIASIDLKKRETGLLEFAQYHNIRFETFTADELQSVEGKFSDSNFVQDKVGVANVCERAAMCMAGEGSVLIKKKISKDGVTLAVAKSKPVIDTFE